MCFLDALRYSCGHAWYEHRYCPQVNTHAPRVCRYSDIVCQVEYDYLCQYCKPHTLSLNHTTSTSSSHLFQPATSQSRSTEIRDIRLPPNPPDPANSPFPPRYMYQIPVFAAAGQWLTNAAANGYAYAGWNGDPQAEITYESTATARAVLRGLEGVRREEGGVGGGVVGWWRS